MATTIAVAAPANPPRMTATAFTAWAFFFPINSEMSTVEGIATAKVVTAGVLLAAFALDWVRRPSPLFPRELRPFQLFALVTVVVTAASTPDPLVAFGILSLVLPILVASILGAWSRDVMLRCLLWTSTGHLLWALVFVRRSVGTSGLDRLTGGTHPIFLGMESAILLVVATSHLIGRTPSWGWRLTWLGLAGLSCYTLVSSASRTALIVAPVAVAVVMIGRNRGSRALASAAAACAALPLLLVFAPDWLATLLPGQNRLGTLSSITGRTVIWERVSAFRDLYLPWGVGFDPIFQSRISSTLRLATLGQPFENSWLHAAVSAGFLGVLLFSYVIAATLFGLWSRARAGQPLAAAAAIFVPTYALISSGPAAGDILWTWLIAVGVWASAGAVSPAADSERSLTRKQTVRPSAGR